MRRIGKSTFASYRPIEEHGRQVSQRSRNDLIHVDNFPSRPSNGDRLLRVFANINPVQPRVWVTSDSFEPLARRYARIAGLPQRPGVIARLRSAAMEAMSKAGLPVVNRPPYDQFMLRFHHFLKESAEFQQLCRKDEWQFPPGFLVDRLHRHGESRLPEWSVRARADADHSARESLYPEKAPISILEELAGFSLRHPTAKAA